MDEINPPSPSHTEVAGEKQSVIVVQQSENGEKKKKKFYQSPVFWAKVIIAGCIAVGVAWLIKFIYDNWKLIAGVVAGAGLLMLGALLSPYLIPIVCAIGTFAVFAVARFAGAIKKWWAGNKETATTDDVKTQAEDAKKGVDENTNENGADNTDNINDVKAQSEEGGSLVDQNVDMETITKTAPTVEEVNASKTSGTGGGGGDVIPPESAGIDEIFAE